LAYFEIKEKQENMREKWIPLLKSPLELTRVCVGVISCELCDQREFSDLCDVL